MRRTLVVAILFAFLLIVVWFALVNVQQVTLHLLFTRVDATVAQVIVATALITMLVTGVAAAIEILARRLERSRLQRRVADLERQLAETRRQLDEETRRRTTAERTAFGGGADGGPEAG